MPMTTTTMQVHFDLIYDKYFKDGDEKRNTLTEFNSNNTKRLNLEETKEKIASLEYIQAELAKME